MPCASVQHEKIVGLQFSFFLKTRTFSRFEFQLNDCSFKMSYITRVYNIGRAFPARGSRSNLKGKGEWSKCFMGWLQRVRGVMWCEEARGDNNIKTHAFPLKSGPAWVRPSALWQKSRCVFRNSACETCKGFEGANAIIYQCITVYLYVYLQHSSFQIKLQRGSGAHSCTLGCQPLQQCLANWTPPVQQLRALINSRKRKNNARTSKILSSCRLGPPASLIKGFVGFSFYTQKMQYPQQKTRLQWRQRFIVSNERMHKVFDEISANCLSNFHNLYVPVVPHKAVAEVSE